LKVLILALGVAVISTAIMTQILGTIKSSDSITTIAVANESMSFAANNTWYFPQNIPVKSITSMWNDSAHSYIYSSAYYTYDPDFGIKLYTNSTNTTEGGWNVTTGTHYVSYVQYNNEYNITEKGQEGLKNLGDWFPTIGIVMAATVVIGLISYFGR